MFCGILLSLLVDAKVDQFSCETSTEILCVKYSMWDFHIQFLMCGLGRDQHLVCLCQVINVLWDPIFFVDRC